MVLTDEERMLQESARTFCTERTPVSSLRALRDGQHPDGFDRGIWREMADLGWPAIALPETYGGLAFGYRGLGIVTEEAGRVLAASPLISTIWLCAALLDAAGSHAHKAELLPQVAAGTLLLSLAIEEGHKHRPHHFRTRAVACEGGYVLNGRKTFVIDGHIADRVIVAAVVSSDGVAGPASDAVILLLVDRDAPGIRVEKNAMVDSRNMATLSFDGVQLAASAVLGGRSDSAQGLARALDIARIGLAAEMLGGVQECLDRTVAYLKERRQFGVPIGSFQALKHRAATLYCDVEVARSCVEAALDAIDALAGDTELARAASLAKCKVGEAFRNVAREAIQIHGGNGMTDEFEIGFFLKRQAVAEQTLGSTAFHIDRYAALSGY